MPEGSSQLVSHDGLRRARALIGWMSLEEAQLLLTGRQASVRLDNRLLRRFQAARQAMLDRQEGICQDGVIEPVDDALGVYLKRFWDTEHAEAFRQEGWRVVMVDLRALCAFQASVFLDHADTRTADAAAGDLQALARITLPLENEAEPVIQFDHLQKAWVISSDNPNLDVVGHFTRPLSGGKGCGFLVRLQPSCMQVGCWQGRYFLKDGYHRALGLLRRGLHRVPALFLEQPEENLDFGPGVLPRAAWLGPRPPRLTDYLSEIVSAEIALPETRRLIVIQALSLNPLR